MQSDKKITQRGYRALAITYICRLSQVNGRKLTELPQPMLSELGITLQEVGTRCVSPVVCVPQKLHSKAVRERIASMKSYLEDSGWNARKPVHDERNGRRKLRDAHLECWSAPLLEEDFVRSIMP